MVLETFIAISQDLIAQFSYPAIFLLSLASTSTIFFPLPIYGVIFFAAGLGLNPLLVGIVAGVGSAAGELTGYLIGAGGKHLVEEKTNSFLKKYRWLKKFKNYFLRYGFPIVILTSFLPFPFDFIGILAGATNYNLKKFFLATVIGKTVKTLLISFAGSITIPYVEFFLQLV